MAQDKKPLTLINQIESSGNAVIATLDPISGTQTLRVSFDVKKPPSADNSTQPHIDRESYDKDSWPDDAKNSIMGAVDALDYALIKPGTTVTFVSGCFKEGIFRNTGVDTQGGNRTLEETAALILEGKIPSYKNGYMINMDLGFKPTFVEAITKTSSERIEELLKLKVQEGARLNDETIAHIITTLCDEFPKSFTLSENTGQSANREQLERILQADGYIGEKIDDETVNYVMRMIPQIPDISRSHS